MKNTTKLRVKKMLSWIPDKTFIEIRYLMTFGKKINLKNPKTFNEKLQWLKLYDRNPKYVMLVDKYEVKKYVTEKIGEKHLIPTLGVWDKFDDIDFDNLPDKFVLKCTHDSGSVYLCQDKSKVDLKWLKKIFDEAANGNQYHGAREWAYKDVKPRIIAEEYMVDESGVELKDYKFFCFGGEVKYFNVDFERFKDHRANYYDLDFKQLPFGKVACPPDFSRKIEKPQNFEEMVILAEKLAGDIPFVRVDLYNVNGDIYFGEMTFSPAAGFGKFTIDEWDRKIGDYIQLPEPNRYSK